MNHRAKKASIILLILPLAVLILLLRQPAKPIHSQMETPEASSYLPYISSAPVPTATASPTAVPPVEEQIEQETAAQINEVRGDKGLAALVLVDELTTSARRHSRDMADKNFTAHEGSDGTYGCQRMLQAGYDYSTCDEIIGWGFGGNTAAMVDWWMHSPTHRDIILSLSYEDFGVGYALNPVPASDWGSYWTVNFGKRSITSNSLSGKIYKCIYRLEGPEGGSSLLRYIREPCPQPFTQK
jgi:uncharacterized protein YkwD